MSPLHRTTALSEVAKQKLVYKCWVHVPQKWKEGAWGEPIVDMFVEGVLGFLAMRAAKKKQYENDNLRNDGKEGKLVNYIFFI